MKKIIFGIFALCSLVACNDFLETQSYTEKNMGNFPQNEKDIQAMVVGIYAAQTSIDASNVAKNHPYMVAEAAGDERYGGGGPSTFDLQGLDKLMVANSNQFDPIWSARYQGIYRVNQLLENIDDCPGFKDEANKQTYKGEAYFLRALFYWELAQLFERVPLVLSTEPVNLPRAAVDDVYAQIGSDFLRAIELLPNMKYDKYQPGRATRWNAEAYLGRVFLFYTGFYEKAEMPLTEGKSLNKTQMIAHLQDCIDNSGHDLVDKFGNLWTYSNLHTKKDYKYAQDLDLSWAGEDNKEVMYSYKYSTLGAGTPNNVSQRNLFASWNALSSSKLKHPQTFPYGLGWCFGCVNKATWDYWQANNPNDVRKLGSFIDLEKEIKNFNPNGFKSWEETMYRSKKHLPITAKDAKGKTLQCFSVLEWGVPNTAKSYVFDFVLMRFAEVLLMQAELKEDASYINRVRTRAGQADVTYTAQNLQDERRWELSFEGLRWNDIRRWHIAENVLDQQIGETVYNQAKEATIPTLGGGYVARYKLTRGFWMVPQRQIDLSGGVLDQNAGWEEPACIYSGWK